MQDVICSNLLTSFHWKCLKWYLILKFKKILSHTLLPVCQWSPSPVPMLAPVPKVAYPCFRLISARTPLSPYLPRLLSLLIEEGGRRRRLALNCVYTWQRASSLSLLHVSEEVFFTSLLGPPCWQHTSGLYNIKTFLPAVSSLCSGRLSMGLEWIDWQQYRWTESSKR